MYSDNYFFFWNITVDYHWTIDWQWDLWISLTWAFCPDDLLGGNNTVTRDWHERQCHLVRSLFTRWTSRPSLTPRFSVFALTTLLRSYWMSRLWASVITSYPRWVSVWWPGMSADTTSSFLKWWVHGGGAGAGAGARRLQISVYWRGL